MGRLASSRAALVALYLAMTAAAAAGTWVYGFGQALGPLAARGSSDLALAADRLVTQLQRYREVAVLMADHPALVALHAGGPRAAADRVLLDAADKTGSLSMLYVDLAGRVLAAAHPGAPRALPPGPHLERARDGALGQRLSARPGGARVFSYAAPQFGPDGRVHGMLVVSADIARLEQVWRGSLPTVWFADATGTVVATNRRELLGWRKGDGDDVISPAGRVYRTTMQRRAGLVIRRQDWSPYVPPAALYLTEALPVIGLDAMALVDVAPARRIAALQAGAVAAVVLFFGALLFLATERRRALAQANAALEGRVSARTRALSEANAALRREVAERQEAEAALKRAQAELVQAGKLTALGKMSAGISHELNQPLMAIRSFAENGQAFLDRGRPDRAAENLGRISDMAGRMGRIIRNLRAFARQEAEPASRVGLAAVVEGALEMVQDRATAMGATLDWQRPDTPTVVMAGEVRLSQVIVNLLTNALDAMADAPERRVTIRVGPGATDGRVALTVRDTGPGISDPDRIFDPFYSTKEVGATEGMGLGLSISYGLVQGFGGRLRGENAPGGGALFTVELDRAEAFA
ncbi:sensor histidine kinase [Roseivivax isoporae]|uniref:C4-dicarboxylate transport sensor protein DctB n=1 Tax=Roseivivax isoporae LMG 25204 TaxID=1449351 RepID=X7F526_9RHOB|nr:ATP-binding protein [Roseivivax isoporae]ETX27191.1 C4-dicarboxylate ABC transporter [Roseivivax isoporae LMG 25204]